MEQVGILLIYPLVFHSELLRQLLVQNWNRRSTIIATRIQLLKRICDRFRWRSCKQLRLILTVVVNVAQDDSTIVVAALDLFQLTRWLQWDTVVKLFSLALPRCAVYGREAAALVRYERVVLHNGDGILLPLDTLYFLEEPEVLRSYFRLSLALQRSHLLQQIISDLFVPHFIFVLDSGFHWHHLCCYRLLLLKCSTKRNNICVNTQEVNPKILSNTYSIS